MTVFGIIERFTSNVKTTFFLFNCFVLEPNLCQIVLEIILSASSRSSEGQRIITKFTKKLSFTDTNGFTFKDPTGHSKSSVLKRQTILMTHLIYLPQVRSSKTYSKQYSKFEIRHFLTPSLLLS